MADPAEVKFNIHLIRYAPRPDRLAVASPNCVHRDGEATTFAHLLGRCNVEGSDVQEEL